MQSLVVFLAIVGAACSSYVAQPPHHPAVVLDPHGRPLDTAEVIGARARHLQAKALEHSRIGPAPLAIAIAPLAYTAIAPSTLSHHSRVNVVSSPAIIANTYAAPLLLRSALTLAGHGHYLKKRLLGHIVYTTPLVHATPIAHAVVSPAAVSHQSRVDIVSKPAVVTHAIATPVLAHTVAVPIIAPAAVSHQSRVDIRTSPATVTHSYVPLQYSPGLYGHGLHY